MGPVVLDVSDALHLDAPPFVHPRLSVFLQVVRPHAARACLEPRIPPQARATLASDDSPPWRPKPRPISLYYRTGPPVPLSLVSIPPTSSSKRFGHPIPSLRNTPLRSIFHLEHFTARVTPLKPTAVPL